MKRRKNKTFLMPIEVKPDGKRGIIGGAYTLAFVYSPKGNFLIKGYHREVENYISSTFNRALVNYTLWRKCSSIKTYRSVWEFIKCNVYIHKTYKQKKQYKWKFYDIKRKEYVLELKRLPKYWITQFNQFYK